MNTTKSTLKPIIFFIAILCGSLLGCKNQEAEEKITRLENQLDSLISRSVEARPVGELVHLVFFKTKNMTSRDSLGLELSKLNSIESIKTLRIGTFKDLGDPRAMAAYDLVLYTSFSDSLAYRKYQLHPQHLQLKEATKSFLAGPPITYDYQIE